MTSHPAQPAPFRPDPQPKPRTPVGSTSGVAVDCPSVTRSRLLALLIVSMATTLLLVVHCLRSCDLITRRHQTCCHGSVNISRGDEVARENQVSRGYVLLQRGTLENVAVRENSVVRVGKEAREVARVTGQFSRETKVSRDCLESQKLSLGTGSSLAENQVSRKDSVSHALFMLLGNRNQTSREKGIHVTRENRNQISRENLHHISRENKLQIYRVKEKAILTENITHTLKHITHHISAGTKNKTTAEIEAQLSQQQTQLSPRPNELSRDDGTQVRLKRRLPQCLIIGVRKGGTRALLEFLNLHPAISAGKQEMHFFDDDRKYSLGLDWYRKRMGRSLPEQITVEKTPAYFVGERVPQRVHAMNSSIRLLLTVRDPIDRAISDYLQIHTSRVKRGKFHPRFEELAIDARTGQVNRSYKAIRRSIYHRHFDRWLRYFRLEQFHFVSGENLVRDPVEELRKVERFLGIENRLDEGRFYYNRTRGFYCMVAPDGTERCLAPSKGRIHPDVDPEAIEKLRRFFRPHNQLFYQMVGVDFGWK